MPTFYRLASLALQPGGTLAIWCSGDIRAAPDLPNAEKIQAAIDHHLDVELDEWRNEGNRLVRGGYKEMEAPWGGRIGEGGEGEDEGRGEGVQEGGGFEREGFVRRKWGVGEMFYKGLPGEEKGIGLGMLEVMLGTGSAETRWKEAVS